MVQEKCKEFSVFKTDICIFYVNLYGQVVKIVINVFLITSDVSQVLERYRLCIPVRSQSLFLIFAPFRTRSFHLVSKLHFDKLRQFFHLSPEYFSRLSLPVIDC